MSNQVAAAPWYDTLQQFKTGVFSSLRVCLPGTVSGVDLVNRTVDVTIGVLQNTTKQGLPDGLDFPYPQLLACPMVTLYGGHVGVVMPVAVGDECLVIFSDRCLDSWFKTGQPTPLPNFRMHDIGDGFALIGLSSLGKKILTPIAAGSGGISELAAAGAQVAVNPSTHLIKIANASQDLKTSLALLLSTLTTLNLAIASDAVFLSTSPAVAAAATAANLVLVTINSQLANLLE